MREIDVKEITKAVKELCIEAGYILPKDLENIIRESVDKEPSSAAKAALCAICDNIDAAKRVDLPICQDTGMAIVFLKIGQEVHISGGNITDAVNEGVRQGYLEGYMRCSIVKDPLNRINTGDNTPAVIYTEIVEGDTLSITVAPKGFGSENMSDIKMFTPSAAREDIIDFVTEVVNRAGSNPCPPIVIGIGIGGSFDYAALLSKKALTRDVSKRNENPYYSRLEEDILTSVNKTGIGAQGFGGRITALAVNIEYFPTHIAGLPVAVNIGCHVTRHKSRIL